MTDSEPTPPLTESARSVFDAARGVAGAWGGSFAALRRLLVADLALARVATVRALLLLMLAAIMFATLWALLTAFTVWLMLQAGLGWGMALGLPLLVSAIVCALAVVYALKALRLANLEASRREIAAWFEHAEALSDSERAASKASDTSQADPSSSGPYPS